MNIALTGATGRIGRVLRAALLEHGYTLTSSDRAGDPPPPHPRDSYVAGDLRDRHTVDAVLKGTQALVHLAATSNEQAFAQILENNHHALQEVYEGARRHGLRRVVYASSNHAFGLHPVTTKLRLDAPPLADCFYGLSKIWGESLGRMYWEKHGIETVALRIGTFMDCPPRNARELSTWIGREDLLQLTLRALEAPAVGFAAVWGISANTRAYCDLAEGNAIGYVPPQNAEDYADAVYAQAAATPDPVAERYQGGRFVTQDYTPENRRPAATPQ